jgi:DNA repair photolyase
MILSVSRRTDIPAFYSEWFMNRVKAGYLYVRNPFNYNQISKIDIKPDKVDCIVFWTKDPKPIINKLDELDNKGYHYYFQFTITPYNEDLETNLPNKREVIAAFIELSEKIGKEKVVLRYDPIIITDKYNEDFHIRAFDKLCEKLHNHTQKVVFSFVDDYRKVSRNMKNVCVSELTDNQMKDLSHRLIDISRRYGLSLETCAERIDLSDLGIGHAKCIDGELIQKIVGNDIKYKDKLDGNREYCGCMKCIDIGQYDTCIHNCTYCYANINKEKAWANYRMHNVNSPILLGTYNEEEVKERKDIKSFRVDATEQLSLFEE